MMFRFRPIVLFVLVTSCTCSEESPSIPLVATDVPALFEADGVLAVTVGAASQDFDVPLTAGTLFEVRLDSEAFDPVLLVHSPGDAVMTNDDWQGSRTESRIRGVAAIDGALKITVTSFEPAAIGSFHLEVRPVAGAAAMAPAVQLTVGQTLDGELVSGDAMLPDGRWVDRYVVPGFAGASLELRIESTTDTIPSAILMNPLGHTIGTSDNGRYAITQPGPHRLQLIGEQPSQNAGYRISLNTATGGIVPTLARSHHTFPRVLNGVPLELGRTIQGQLTSAIALPTGESATIYQVEATEGQPMHIEMKSAAFDAYLLLLSPGGRHWENDDRGGTTDAGLDLVIPESGTYHIVATAYQADMNGTFELKTGSEYLVAGTSATATGGVEEQVGTLAAGDVTISSGEFADSYEFQLTQGEHIRFAAISSEFDTYLIVRPPSGEQSDNDDGSSSSTNAAIDYLAPVTGSYRVLVTSYQPGESGSYTLQALRGGASTRPTNVPSTVAQPSVATGDSVSGTLAAGDATLDSGEFIDVFTRTFTPGQAARVRLESSSFDAYLIMMAPDGAREDNDDFEGIHNAGFDIPSAMSGEYRFAVTSDQPGESGAYTLRFDEGTASPQATPNHVSTHGNTPAASTGRPRIFGLFAGISDYPDGVGDLPECANDAIKLAEALRNRGLLIEARQVLLTDAQATRANLLQGIQRLANQMQPSDVFVFFYSGHGGQGMAGSQDAREIDGADEFLVLYDGQLLDDQLATAFDTVTASTSLIALDACNSGGFAKDLITRPGRVGLFSSEEDVLSAVAGQFQAGGYLSHFLRTGVMGEADTSPQDRVLTVGELARFLRLQFSAHASDVQLQGAYQHIVVDRGAVSSNQVLWRY